MGSSPLTRGKPANLGPVVEQVGLIPAHAGKTATSCGKCPPITAHPRSRGENINSRRPLNLRAGSSPLTRGKLMNFDCEPDFSGLIPAHAGKTPESFSPIAEDAAHPRSRGENPNASTLPKRAGGSSPLTRGKQVCACVFFTGRGLIPAHAGKTTVPPSSTHCGTAHPRSRGENLK